MASFEDGSIVIIWATYIVLAIGWCGMQLQRWWYAKQGKDIDEGIHIGAQLDEVVMKRWLLIIIISSGFATLFAFAWTLELDILTMGESSILVGLFLTPSVTIGAWWLYTKSPALTGLNPWMVSVAIGSMTIISTLILTIDLFPNFGFNGAPPMAFLMPISGWVSTVYVLRLMSAVSAERVRILRVKREDDPTKVSEDLNTGSKEDDYSNWNLFDEKSELMALASMLCFVTAGLFSGMWWFSIITADVAIIAGAGAIIIIASIAFTKPDAIIMIGRPLYRRNHDNVVIEERLVLNAVNNDGDRPGGWSKEQWEKYGDSSKKR